jgi:aspartyl-tRNA(Asn)/glutamyl-tRNA(Gln) amidotransferase subunit C
MLSITREEVVHVAQLARLHLGPDQLAAMQHHFEQILEHFARLAEIDTEGVEPTFHPLPRVNVMREDEPTEPMDRERILRNAPSGDEECFLVPLIMEDE